MIEIKNVSKNYSNVKSLDDVSAEIKKGSIFGLIGSNGSGKSTLLRIMCGIFQSDGGSVDYDGEPIYENKEAKRGILYLSDDQYFIPYATLDEMKEFYKSVYACFDEEMYAKLYSLFNLDPKRRISTFSKGMQKQASLLLALSCRPDYLLCDETFDGLDPVMRNLVKRLIAEESATRNMTTVIASHNLRELEDICDHIALLHKGKLIFVSDIDNMKENIHAVQAVFSREISEEDLAGLKITGFSRRGSMISVVCRGSERELREYFSSLCPEFFEIIPLTLEEIFISEMEEYGYDYSNLGV